MSGFEDGYVEAMFARLNEERWCDNAGRAPAIKPELGFSDLAPETLAAIRKDCAEAVEYRSIPFGRWFNPNGAGGRCFWSDRQDGRFPGKWPPLHLSLGNDGLVRFSPSEGGS